MGVVVDLQAWRRRHGVRRSDGPRADVSDPDGPGPHGSIADVPRLDAAVARLDRVMRAGTGRISATVESELSAITGALTTGRMDEAAVRAERLAERLEHPSSSLAR